MTTASCYVGANCCIYFGRDKHYYSVPYHFIGKQVHVEYTRTLVKIYADGRLLKAYERDYSHGRYTICDEHLASNSREYRDRTPQRYIERCEKVSVELGRLVTLMFHTSRLPAEMHYRSCDGLLSLQRTTDPVLFRTACEIAIEYGRYNYRFVRQLIDSRCAGVHQHDLLMPPEHGNIRGREQFT